MKKTLFALTLLIFGATACGGRVPSNATAANIAKKHFKKYGKKFKATEFAVTPVSTVEVKAIEELQKNVATGFLVVKLDSGSEIPVIMTFLRKFPLGWRTTGWERASPATP